MARIRSRRKRVALAVAGVFLHRHWTESKRKKKTRVWVKPHIRFHDEQGAFFNLFSKFDNATFANFSRLEPDIFQKLLKLLTPLIKKEVTNYRCAISPAERLAITLRFLATGETFKSLGYQFRVGNTTIGRIVPETCEAIHTLLAPMYMKCPQTVREWTTVADDFQTAWNFPNCVGALDGKHVNIKPPMNSGSVYFNYKHRFSIVLMALVDAHYKFLYVDVGSNGRVSDGGVFKGCTLDQALQNKTANLPPPKPVPGDERPIPYAVVADEAFPLREYIMKPYPQRNLDLEKRVFNYRLSRARRVVENPFGILANRFRVLLSNIALSPEKVTQVVLACCCLHNMLRTEIGAGCIVGVGDSEHPVTHDIHSWQKWLSPPNI